MSLASSPVADEDRVLVVRPDQALIGRGDRT
jgi:hypothetical protein